MDVRSRVLAVLQGQKPDVVPWLGDLDYWMQYLRASGRMPEQYEGDGLYQYHRDLGVGFYLQGYFPFKTVYDLEVVEEPAGVGKITRVKTPHGDLTEFQEWIPESYCIAWSTRFVKDWRDLAAYRYFVEHTHYEPDYALAARRYELIGDNGLVLCYLPRSPFMHMVAIDAGIRTISYALADAPDEFEATFETLKRKHDEASEIAVGSPAECLMIPENLSSEVVGKRLFNRFVRPHDSYWVKRIHDAGKHSFIHIDGTLKGLIRECSETGFRVLEAVTPHPVGDIPPEEVKDWVEPGTIIWGGIPGLYFSDLISDEEFDAYVIRVLQVWKSEARYVLGVADQVPPLSRPDRIARVAPLVERYGRYD
jgi:hypothetical protein